MLVAQAYRRTEELLLDNQDKLRAVWVFPPYC